MNADSKTRAPRKIIWVATAVVLGAIVAANPFYAPRISLATGVAALFVDLAIVLVLSVQPATVRPGMLVSGLFFAVPCFLPTSFFRALLMCCTAFPFVIATASLFAPPTADFRERLAYFFSWLGTHRIERRARKFDILTLLHLAIATAVLAACLAEVKTISTDGVWLYVRWLAGGMMMMMFAEMATASHDFLTSLMGISAPSLMRSPILSTSIGEFWTKRWNVAASELVFRQIFFVPIVRFSVVLALFAAFFASAVAHALLALMAIESLKLALALGAFFLVQPLLILAERGMKVRHWRTTAARVWTLTALAVTSPLFVEPAVQTFVPSLKEWDNVLMPTVLVLGFALVVNLLVNAGQLVFCVKSSPADTAPDRSFFVRRHKSSCDRLSSAMRTNHKDENGFTLIELLVVIAIIAVLAALLVPALNWGERGESTLPA